jgi:hypothetical protein
MKKILALTALALCITGCKTEDDIAQNISKTFSFTHAKDSLEYSEMSKGFYLVKSDSELYLYNTDSNIIVPAPKAVFTEQNALLEDTVNRGEITFHTIFKQSALTSIRNLAEAKTARVETTDKLEKQSIPQRPLPKQPALTNENGASINTQASIDTEQNKSLGDVQAVNTSPSSTQEVKKPDPIVEAKKTGEANLTLLKAELAKRLSNSGSVSTQPLTQSLPVAPSTTPTLASTEHAAHSIGAPSPLLQKPAFDSKTPLTSGIQYAYFNGTPVLKIAYSEDGRLLSATEKKNRIIETAKKIINMNWTINYPAVGKEKLQLIVFTDYTCPFCHKLHNDIQVLNQAGITVRYMYYPRAYSAGPRTPAAMLTMEQMRRSWCAPNQGEAMTELFENRQIEDYKCDVVPEAKGRAEFPGPYHHFFGELFDLDSTPLYFTSDGQMNTGYSTFEDFKKNKIKIPE